MPTLGEMKASGAWITLHCEAQTGFFCYHYSTPSMDQLIQYFGADFDLSANRKAFLSRFVCEGCGRRYAQMIYNVGPNVRGEATGVGSHSQGGPEVTVAESIAHSLALNAENRAKGIVTNEDRAMAAYEWRKAQKAAERNKGDSFIGPPNPRRDWKPRARMKRDG